MPLTRSTTLWSKKRGCIPADKKKKARWDKRKHKQTEMTRKIGTIIEEIERMRDMVNSENNAKNNELSVNANATANANANTNGAQHKRDSGKANGKSGKQTCTASCRQTIPRRWRCLASTAR